MQVAPLLLVAALCAAQPAQPEKPQTPTDADGAFLASQGAQPRFEFASKLSASAALALRERRLSSVPYFSGSFAFEGKTFPYTIIGSTPQAGGTTLIPTQVIPISLLFEGYADANGDPVERVGGGESGDSEDSDKK